MSIGVTDPERKTAKHLSAELVRIDNAMKAVYDIVHKRQSIIYAKEYSYGTLCALRQIFDKDATVHRGSIAVRMANCTIRIYRGADKFYRK